jgi:hydrogenase expression/formation protein HypC
MCLIRPAEVVQLYEQEHAADVRWQGQIVRVDVTLVLPLAPGDRVLVHAGQALERLDAEQAAEIEQALGEWDAMLAEAASAAGEGGVLAGVTAPAPAQ